MDPEIAAARLFERPVSRMLGIEHEKGRTRVEILIEDMVLAGDAGQLVVRHSARAAVRSVLFVAAAAVVALVLIPTTIFVGPWGEPALSILFSPLYFLAFTACLALIKMIVIEYTPESWWVPSSKLLRWIVTSQLFELAVVVPATVFFLFVFA